MEFLTSNDLIIACATGEDANSALGIIRLSGSKCLEKVANCLSINIDTVKPRIVYLSDILDGVEILDNIVLTYYASPASYTGEDLLEFSVHGNRRNIQKILDLFISKGGCRSAQPGEFTYRALRNKKLSLTQVEGIDLLLNADSDFVLKQGQSLLRGDLQKSYLELRKVYLDLRSSLELAIDFFEDVAEDVAKEKFELALKSLGTLLEKMVGRASLDVDSLIAPKVVLFGAPNAGKSSCFNRMLKFSRSIISTEAGTTRDYISERINIDNTSYTLVDTAGLRETKNSVEGEGVLRARKLSEEAFFKILLINPFDSDLQKLDYDVNGSDCVIFTHSDLEGHDEAVAKIRKRIKSGNQLALSLIDPNVDFDDIFELLSKKYRILSKDDPILISRHRILLRTIHDDFSKFSKICKNEKDLGIISAELNAIGRSIEQLIGILPSQEILSSIFENFCIGK